jgi:CxxC motif-containing protein (DUF1111 family)
MSSSLHVFRLALIGALVTACGTEPQGVAGGGDERSHPVLSANVGGPMPGLSQQERRLFDAGKAQFERVFTPATGLGPLFNGNSCATCHAAPAAGGVGPQIERHATAFMNGTCEEHEEINGGSVMQSDATPLLRAAGISEERRSGGHADRFHGRRLHLRAGDHQPAG